MKSGRDRIEKIREGQQRALDERRKLLERMKGRQATALEERDAAARAVRARADRFKFVDVARTLDAAGKLRFWDLEPSLAGSGHQLNRPTLELTGHFLRVLRQELSLSVLQWPFGQRDISLLHPIAMLSVMAASPEAESGGYCWCPPVQDFRTLYFPWRGTATASNIRDLLVNRRELSGGRSSNGSTSCAQSPKQSVGASRAPWTNCGRSTCQCRRWRRAQDPLLRVRPATLGCVLRGGVSAGENRGPLAPARHVVLHDGDAAPVKRCSSRSRTKFRFAVCCCFFGRPLSAASMRSMMAMKASSFGRTGGFVRR